MTTSSLSPPQPSQTRPKGVNDVVSRDFNFVKVKHNYFPSEDAKLDFVKISRRDLDLSRSDEGDGQDDDIQERETEILKTMLEERDKECEKQKTKVGKLESKIQKLESDSKSKEGQMKEKENINTELKQKINDLMVQ